MVDTIKAHILERISELRPKLNKARATYANNHDESWAGRVAELAGRIEELENIMNKIRRHENRYS